ncbi:MAG: hypothetical protein DHS20C19_21530 [Acidimicrobiales bacterium]|nr:MAG: hypothetical protein DHS20C19_21530 [Acidimicrobiales bacterium]
MQVLAVEFDLRLPGCQSLKDKRAVLRPVIDGLRNRHPVSVAETDHQELWQRGAIGVAVVSETSGHAQAMMDEAERFVWSFPEIEVLSATARWLEED